MTPGRYSRGAFLIAPLLLVACVALFLVPTPARAASLTSAPFGTTLEGTPVTRYTMATGGGVSVSFMS